jgi:branched-chain amino acid transport system permease protein
LGEIIKTIVIQGGSVTGASSGLILPSASFTSMGKYYYCGLALACLTALMVHLVSRSATGLALIAIRDSEVAASASGIPILRHKVGAFAVCAFLAGLCGSLQAYYLFQVSAPSYFNLNWTLLPIIICVLGGLGTVIGPLLGTVVMVLLLEASKAWLPTVHPAMSGALIIVAVLFLPGGILGVRANGRLVSSD